MTPDDPRHGSSAGYRAHKRDGEDACQACLDASATYRRHLYAQHYLHGPRLIDSTGTRRRLEALVALGYTWEHLTAELAALTGRTFAYKHVHQRHAAFAEGRLIGREYAAEFAELYDRLSMRLPDETVSARRASLRAQRLGWLPPLAWDDDTLDDPNAKPYVGQIRKHYRGPELIEEWEHLRYCGVTIERAAEQLGVTVDAIQKAIRVHAREGAA